MMFFFDELINNPMWVFLALEAYFLLLLFFVLSAMFGEVAEKRILAFFIYFELTHLLCVLLLLSWGFAFGSNVIEFSTVSLFLIGSSGAETGIALALFMRYFRLTGRTTFFPQVVVKQSAQRTSLFATGKRGFSTNYSLTHEEHFAFHCCRINWKITEIYFRLYADMRQASLSAGVPDDDALHHSCKTRSTEFVRRILAFIPAPFTINGRQNDDGDHPLDPHINALRDQLVGLYNNIFKEVRQKFLAEGVPDQDALHQYCKASSQEHVKRVLASIPVPFDPFASDGKSFPF